MCMWKPEPAQTWRPTALSPGGLRRVQELSLLSQARKTSHMGQGKDNLWPDAERAETYKVPQVGAL